MLNPQAASHQNKLILFGIILIASALRLHDFLNLPFSHDEYSAILRTPYTNLHDLIEIGVKPDFHPASIQFFLYFWVKLFGTDPWIVKLPFVLASIASIYLGYLVAKKWTNETVGLIVASFLATTQYTIVYGTYARPYTSGLFFTLLLVLALTNLVQHPEYKFRRNWLLFVFAGAACAYNHYVSMLIAGMIGLSAFPLIPKKIRWHYVFAGFSIGILYLPHLSILLYHMSKGGVGGADGWLRAPEPTFIIDYLSYLFHHSLWSALLIVFILLSGWYWGRKVTYTPAFSSKKRTYIFICWFVVPFLICYFYSVHKNPILQFSVLIFSHFLIYIFLFGHIKPLKPIGNSIIVTAVILTNVLTLVFVRKHFYVHYNIGYETALKKLEDERKIRPSLPALISSDFRFTDYLQKKWEHSIPFDKYQFPGHIELLNYLDSISNESDYFYFVESDQVQPNVIPVIQRYYPKIEWQQNNQANSIFLFSKHGEKSYSGTIHHWTPSEKLPEQWKNVKPEKLIIRHDAWVYHIDSLTEWGPAISFDLKDIAATTNNVIDIELNVEDLDFDKEVIITAIVKDKDSTILWSGSNSIDQSINGENTVIHHSVSIPKMKYIKNNQLEIMIWNRGKSAFTLKNVSVRLREGNPYRYTLFNPIYPTVTSKLKGLQPR